MKPPFIPNVISEMKEYLDEISLFNHINEDNQENTGEIDEVTNARFAEYDFEKGPEKKVEKKAKGTLKKYKRGSQKKILG